MVVIYRRESLPISINLLSARLWLVRAGRGLAADRGCSLSYRRLAGHFCFSSLSSGVVLTQFSRRYL